MEQIIDFKDIKFDIPNAKVVTRKQGIARVVLRPDGGIQVKSITFVPTK